MSLGVALGISIVTVGLAFQSMGSILLLGGYMPQIFKLHKTKNPTGISALFWSMIAIGCTAIAINMVLQGTSTEVILTQALNALLAWYTLALVMVARKKHGIETKDSPWLYVVAVVIGAYFIREFVINGSLYSSPAELGNLLQTIGTFALLVAYLPQIWYLYKVKDATGISHWLFLVQGSGLLLVTVNMMITGTSTYIIVTEFINIGLIFVQWVLTRYYQSKKINKKL